MKEKNILEIKGLCKSYGDIKAVDNLSFSVKEGQLFAFLGLNGAGKSTTISIICGTVPKDSGTVVIDGQELSKSSKEAQSNLGVVFQNTVLDKPLTVYDNLKSRGALYGLRGTELKKRIERLSNLLQLETLLGRTFGKLSGGQRRRVDIARALLHEPKILILDEPTTGLDPQTRHLIWDVIDRLRKERGITVFLTTHYMEEAESSDYAVILDCGRISAEGTPLELKEKYGSDYLTLYGVDKKQIEVLGKKYECVNDTYKINVANSKEATEIIVSNPALFTDYELTKGRMDDVFLAVTGKKLTGGTTNVND